MKLFKKTTLVVAILSIVLIRFNVFATNENKGKDKKEENIESLNKIVEEALTTRHYGIAKESINKMLPLMKRDLKESKKLLSDWDKSEIGTELEKQSFIKQLDFNNYIYNSIRKLVDSSPAALRVKGKHVISILNNYKSLVNR